MTPMEMNGNRGHNECIGFGLVCLTIGDSVNIWSTTFKTEQTKGNNNNDYRYKNYLIYGWKQNV